MANRAQLRLLAVPLLVPLLVAFALTMFAWPSANLQPRDLPLGLVGQTRATAAIAAHLQAATDSGFDLQYYTDEPSARAAITRRDVYGAIVISRTVTTLLIASAAGPMVAQLLTQALTAGASEAPTRVVDVVPTPANDPRGAAFGSSVLPFVLSGVIAAILIALLGSVVTFQAMALVVTACLAGLVADGIAQGWLGVLRGSWAANSGVLMLSLLAISATIVGLKSLLGYPGMGAGAFLMMFVGNPLSGATSAPELLPRPWGSLGQLLPPGAGANLLRSTAFFGGAGASTHLAVLIAWILVGFAALLASGLTATPSPAS